MGSTNDTIQGFKFMETRFDANCKAGHTLFFKEHNVRNSHATKPVGKTLFILNVPPYYTKESIKRIFGETGSITSVTFQEKPSGTKDSSDTASFFSKDLVEGFKVAYVVYKNDSGLKKAMKMSWSVHTFSTEDHTINTGISKWVKDYQDSFVNAPALQAEVDRYMEEFDRKKKKEDEKLRMKEGEADDEGWVTVTKHSKNAARTETMEQKVLGKDQEKQKEKKLVNFYSFQMRESKMEHLSQLRKKFEEDKKRIASMKAARKFKPY